MNLEQYIELRDAYKAAEAAAVDSQYMGTMREQRAAWNKLEKCAEQIIDELGMTPAELVVTINALTGKENLG